MSVVALASPLLKCVLPDSPPLDTRVQHDVFGSPYNFEDQPRLTRARVRDCRTRRRPHHPRVFLLADRRAGACFDAAASALHELAEEASKRGIVIGLENEHACNAGTGAEASRLLSRLDHPALKVVWDPANASILGETPFPDGYAQVPADPHLARPRQGLPRRDHKPSGAPSARWASIGKDSWPL